MATQTLKAIQRLNLSGSDTNSQQLVEIPR